MKVVLRVWPSRGAQRSAESASFLKVEPRKKQVTLYDLAAGAPGSAGPHRTATALLPKMFAFDAVYPQDSEQVRGRGRQPGATGSAPCQGGGGRPQGPAAWPVAVLFLPGGESLGGPRVCGSPPASRGPHPGFGWLRERCVCPARAGPTRGCVRDGSVTGARACVVPVAGWLAPCVPCVPVSCLRVL